MRSSKEFENFDTAMHKVISVSREELKRREDQWKREHPKKKKSAKKNEAR